MSDGRADTGDEGQPTRRVAVVFVHGQGEQTPMADVEELVEAVWRRDPRAAEAATPGLAPVYATPLYDRERSDQRRIVTRVVDLKNSDGETVARQQVDFYQFYWADLMRGNRFVHLWKWFTGLIVRQPDEVPRNLWLVRMLVMWIALAVAVWSVLLAAITAVRLAPDVDAPSIGGLVLLALLAVVMSTRPPSAPRSPNKQTADKEGARKLAVGLFFAVLVFAWLALYPLGPALYACWRWPIFEGWLWGLKSLAVSLALGALAALLVLRRRPEPGSRDPWFLGRQPRVWDAEAIKRQRKFWCVALAVLVLGYGIFVLLGGLTPSRWRWADAAALLLAGGAVWVGVLCLRPHKRADAFKLGVPLVLAATAASALLLSGVVAPQTALCPWPELSLLHEAAFAATFVVVAAIAVFGKLLEDSFLVPVMTDSARLFSNSPVNVPNQNNIRKRGMELLDMLHGHGLESSHGRKYDRIVVLAHSLGTVVAYRLLAHYWGVVYASLDPESAAEEAEGVQAAADALNAGPFEPGGVTAALVNYRSAVRRYWGALRARGDARDVKGKAPPERPWLISDFVTIGSPLTYARLLLEESDQAFLKQIELYKRHPTSPPQGRMSDSLGQAYGPIFDAKHWPHHAALFAATCWTNLFFPPYQLTKGDMVGGVIAGDPPAGLGRGVLDVDLAEDSSVQGFTHNEYWKWPSRSPVSPDDPYPPMHVAALRDALGLFRADEAQAQAADRRLLDPNASYLAGAAAQVGTPAPLGRAPRVSR